jgi:hypothetical protein
MASCLGCGGGDAGDEQLLDGSREGGDTGDADDTGVVLLDLPEQELCSPAAGGPHWLLELETLTFTVSCASGLELDGADFSFADLPTGAVYDPGSASFEWTPGLAQADVYELEILVDSLDESGTVKIGVADRFDDPANIPVVDPTTYTEEYGLPVLHLDNSPGLNNEFYSPATVIYRGHVYTAESKLRGASSLGYPKNNYTLKFTKEDKFSDPQVIDGFLEKRKLVLTTTFDDNTYIRQRLSFELWNRLDPGHIQVQAYNAVVFLDGEYWGLYMIGDHIDGYLMEDHGLFQDGNLFKARTHDANFRLVDYEGDPKGSPHQGLTKSEGFPLDGEPGAFDDLDELVNFVATATSADFLAELDSRIDQRDYENWWIFVTAISGGDSAGKNSYHYHDPAGGPWRYVPWDFNYSFGQDWRTIRVGSDEDPESYQWANEFFVRFLGEPTIGPGLRTRYMQVMQNQYALQGILDTVDAWEVENLRSALRDERKWGDAYLNYSSWNGRSDFLDHMGEMDYLRTWITDRWSYLASLY